MKPEVKGFLLEDDDDSAGVGSLKLATKGFVDDCSAKDNIVNTNQD